MASGLAFIGEFRFSVSLSACCKSQESALGLANEGPMPSSAIAMKARCRLAWIRGGSLALSCASALTSDGLLMSPSFASPARAPIPEATPTCWFQPVKDAQQLVPSNCRVVRRVDAQGRKVLDVIEPNGLKRSVVLWGDQTVEVLVSGATHQGHWYLDGDGDYVIVLASGVFAFSPPVSPASSLPLPALV